MIKIIDIYIDKLYTHLECLRENLVKGQKQNSNTQWIESVEILDNYLLHLLNGYLLLFNNLKGDTKNIRISEFALRPLIDLGIYKIPYFASSKINTVKKDSYALIEHLIDIAMLSVNNEKYEKQFIDIKSMYSKTFKGQEQKSQWRLVKELEEEFNKTKKDKGNIHKKLVKLIAIKNGKVASFKDSLYKEDINKWLRERDQGLSHQLHANILTFQFLRDTTDPVETNLKISYALIDTGIIVSLYVEEYLVQNNIEIKKDQGDLRKEGIALLSSISEEVLKLYKN